MNSAGVCFNGVHIGVLLLHSTFALDGAPIIAMGRPASCLDGHW